MDPKRTARAVDSAARQITAARLVSSAEYADAVRQVHADGVPLSAVADRLGTSYYSLWSADAHE